MKKKSPWMMLLVLMLVFGGFLTLFVVLAKDNWLYTSTDHRLRMSRGKEILHLELNGIILDGKKLLKPLIRYREDESIRAIVIEINSPGGVVGPSQEIYEEIKRVREKFNKPVVAVSTGLMASGAYYAAVAADKIVVAPGAMMGSIGVIMEFTNLEKLYDWAKVSRFSISTGKYKDSGAEYRPMREDERALFQDMIDDVYGQFVNAVAKGRNLKLSDVKPYADGRVFTGQQGVKLGFADQVGTLEDAYALAAEIAQLKPNEYEIVEPPKPRPGLFDLLQGGDDEEASTSFLGHQLDAQIDKALKTYLRVDLNNQPLLLMPGVWSR